MTYLFDVFILSSLAPLRPYLPAARSAVSTAWSAAAKETARERISVNNFLMSIRSVACVVRWKVRCDLFTTCS